MYPYLCGGFRTNMSISSLPAYCYCALTRQDHVLADVQDEHVHGGLPDDREPQGPLMTFYKDDPYHQRNALFSKT